ncbi:MAG: ABC transporter substrate-binding protein [Microthrixaceae bacterium]
MESSGSESEPDTLRVVLQAEPTSLNPTFSPFSDSRAWGAIFDSLVGFDRQTLQPNKDGLLTEWEQTSPTEWIFDVRDGVTFHDGEEFNAEAAAFTIEELRDNPASILRGYYSIVKDAKATDGKLQITTVKPYLAMPTLLTNAYALPPEYYAKVKAEGFAKDPIGTGPYKLETYSSGSSIDVVKNDDYWRGEPKLDGIEFAWSAEASSRYALLASGDVDFAIDLLPQDVEKVKNDDSLKETSGETTYGLTLFLNTTKEPFDDVKLREAAAKTIDRDGIVKSLFDGTGATVSRALIGDILTEKYEVNVERDVDAAKALVSAAGKPEIVFGYTSGKFPKDSVVGGAVSGALKDVGFNVKERAEEFGAYRELRDKNAFDAFMQEITPTYAHPDTYVRYWLGANASVKTCTNEADYDAYSEEALGAGTPEEAEEVYRKLEDQVIGEDYCYVPLTKTVYSYGMSDRVEGFEAPRNASPEYWKLSLD